MVGEDEQGEGESSAGERADLVREIARQAAESVKGKDIIFLSVKGTSIRNGDIVRRIKESRSN